MRGRPALLACALACVVSAGRASPVAAQLSEPLRACYLDICEQECLVTLDDFLAACDFCRDGSGNCDSEVCQGSIGQCLPYEDCLGVYWQFFELQCAGENNQRSCINAKSEDLEACQACGGCVDECADATLNDCDANATCTDLEIGYGCECNSGFVGDGTSCLVDADGDGAAVDADCDDDDPDSHPGAVEVCDGRDNDCNGSVDEGLTDTDADSVCDAVDVCEGHDDAVDGDGDTVPDGCDACPADVADDSDGDGSCDSSDLCVGDDTSGDADGDGYCAESMEGAPLDCDDAVTAVHPGATESCNEVDDDCDGTVDSVECDVDAGVVVDTDGGVDVDMGTTTADGGVPTGSGSTSGGAGCSVTSASPPALEWLVVSSLAGGLVARRRRRR